MLLNHCCSNLTLSSVSSSLSSHQRSHHGGWSWGLLCYFCLCFPVVKLKINSPCLLSSVCRCLSVVVQVWINSEVCPPSWTLLSGAETNLLWPALMKTDRDVTLGWTVTMATATSLRSVFSASVVGSSRGGGSGHCWSEDWWGEWSKPWSCPQHLRVPSKGPDPEWRPWPGPDLRPIQDWEAPEVGLVERCLQGLPKECTMMVNSTLTHTHTHVWCIVGCLLLGYRRCCVHGLFHSRNVL